jgi:hypothetical protein
MLAETLFLSQIIHNAPSGALWIITNDSWEGIPGILHPIEVVTEEGDWLIKINNDNKEYIERKIKEYDIGDTIVHMQLVSDSGVILVSTFDRMLVINIDEWFERLNGFSKQFPNLPISF